MYNLTCLTFLRICCAGKVVFLHSSSRRRLQFEGPVPPCLYLTLSVFLSLSSSLPEALGSGGLMRGTRKQEEKWEEEEFEAGQEEAATVSPQGHTWAARSQVQGVGCRV